MWKLLIHMVPVRTRRAIRSALALLFEKTPPASPYIESFAISIASSSESKRSTQTTGPKISSCAIRMSLRTFAKMVGV